MISWSSKKQKQIEQVVDSRMLDLRDDIREIMLDALHEGHTTLAASYRELARKSASLEAAYAYAVGTDWNLAARAAKAYIDRWHDPSQNWQGGEIPRAVEILLKEVEGGLETLVVCATM